MPAAPPAMARFSGEGPETRPARREAALPEMQRLHFRCNETVNLGIVEGSDIVCLSMVGSTRAPRLEAAPGWS